MARKKATRKYKLVVRREKQMKYFTKYFMLFPFLYTLLVLCKIRSIRLGAVREWRQAHRGLPNWHINFGFLIRHRALAEALLCCVVCA
uniref:Uncharacterized protein n=1 Tax=Glossina palpalis gambiensis TaxID=67801 RepID=A0A1B0ARV9_9MUSC